MMQVCRQLVRSVALALAVALPSALCLLPTAQAQVTRQAVVEYVATTGAQIQTLIDRQLAGTIARGDIVIPQGQSITISTPILIGRMSGGAWQQAAGITIRSAGDPHPYHGDGADNCGRIVQSSPDLPVVIVQCGRGVYVRGLKLVGASNYVSNVNSAWWTAGVGNNFEDLIGPEANFTAPTAARTNRWSPSCAIAIDPFGSAVPSGDRYPGLSASYYVGNAGSSGVFIERVLCQHVQVGILIGAGVTANSSEIPITNCRFHGCKFPISVSHNQAKNIHVSGIDWNACWSLVTCGRHGQQNGPLVSMEWIRGSYANHLIEPGSASDWPAEWNHGLMEGVLGISTEPIGGAIGSASGAFKSPAMVFRDLSIDLAGPASNTNPQIYAGVNPLVFENCELYTSGSQRKIRVSTSATAWTSNNIVALDMVFRNCHFRLNAPNSVSVATDAVDVVSGHDDNWILFENSGIAGAAVGPSNTRLIRLDGRGL